MFLTTSDFKEHTVFYLLNVFNILKQKSLIIFFIIRMVSLLYMEDKCTQVTIHMLKELSRFIQVMLLRNDQNKCVNVLYIHVSMIWKDVMDTTQKHVRVCSHLRSRVNVKHRLHA